MDTRDCMFGVDPDIGGIGVRLAFYIQSALTMILSVIPGADASGSAYWTMTITALALFVSSLREMAADRLTLYTGAIIAILLYLHAYASLLCMVPVFNRPSSSAPTASRASSLLWGLIARVYPVFVLATALGYTIFIKAGNFGQQRTCDQMATLAIFGIQLRAITTGRSLALAYVSLHAYFFALLLLIAIGFAVRAYLAPTTLAAGIGDRTSMQTRTQTRFGRTNRNLSERLGNRRYMYTMYAVTATAIFTLFVSTAELTIAANSQLGGVASGDAEWTLGQVFPVVMLAVPVVGLLQVTMERRKQRKRRQILQELQLRPVVGITVHEWQQRLGDRYDLDL